MTRLISLNKYNQYKKHHTPMSFQMLTVLHDRKPFQYESDINTLCLDEFWYWQLCEDLQYLNKIFNY